MLIAIFSTLSLNSKAKTNEYDITIESKRLEIDVRPGQPGTTFLYINITNNRPYEITILLEISCLGIVEYTLGEPAIENNVSIYPFSSVSVPLYLTANRNLCWGTYYCDLKTRVVERNRIPQFDDQGRISTLIINILGYSNILIKKAPNYLEFKNGEEHTFELRIINYGNGKDWIKIEIINIEELEKLGWKISLDKKWLNLTDGERGILKVTVKAPSRSYNIISSKDTKIEIFLNSIIDPNASVIYECNFYCKKDDLLLFSTIFVSFFIIVNIVIYVRVKMKKKIKS